MKKLLLAACFTALTVVTGLSSGSNNPAGIIQDPTVIAAEFGKYIPVYKEIKAQLLSSGLSEEKAENATREILFRQHPEFRGLLDQVKGILGQTPRSGLFARCCKGAWNFLKQHKGLIATTTALVGLYYLACFINEHHSDATGKLADEVLSHGVGSLNWMEPKPCTLDQQPADATAIVEPVMPTQNVKAIGLAAIKQTLKYTDLASTFATELWKTTSGLAQQTKAYDWAANTAAPAVKAYATTAYETTQPYFRTGCSYIAAGLNKIADYIYREPSVIENIASMAHRTWY